MNAWREVESKVYRPGFRGSLISGAVSLVVGSCLLTGYVVSQNAANWQWLLISGVMDLIAAFFVVLAITCTKSWVNITHAAPDTLPDIPDEPVIYEGAEFYSRLSHELIENSQGWEYRPAQRLTRTGKGVYIGFIVCFLTLILSGTTFWAINREGMEPIAATLLAIAIGAFCGLVVQLVNLLQRRRYRRLCALAIPRGGKPIVLDAAAPPKLEIEAMGEGVRWSLDEESKRQRLTVSRDLVAAVELCPWRLTAGMNAAGDASNNSARWAFQGLLVLADVKKAEYRREPILLTGDFAGAARLMQELAAALRVPYLFHADAEGCKLEKQRAMKRRPPKKMKYQS
jgi:hypothetical protein